MSRTLDTLDTIAVKTNLCRKYLVGALCNFKTDLSPSFCSQIMYVQFCETDLFQQISSGEYFNISRDKTLDAKRKTNDWSKPLLNMNNHWFGGALCLFYGTRCKNKRKSSSLHGTKEVLQSKQRLLDVELLDCGGWTGRTGPRPRTPWAPPPRTRHCRPSAGPWHDGPRPPASHRTQPHPVLVTHPWHVVEQLPVSEGEFILTNYWKNWLRGCWWSVEPFARCQHLIKHMQTSWWRARFSNEKIFWFWKTFRCHN